MLPGNRLLTTSSKYVGQEGGRYDYDLYQLTIEDYEVKAELLSTTKSDDG